MTFANILADVYRRSRYATSPATEVVTRLKAFVNEIQQELTEDSRLSSLWRGETTFATTASQAEYGLPPQIGRVSTIRDTTNRLVLRQVSRERYREQVPDTTETGTPSEYALLGPKPVKLQPSAATGVWAASSSASDTAGPTVTVEAIRTGGYLHQPTATALTGTSRVQIGSQTDYIEMSDFYLSAACVGDVTLFDAASSGNTLGVIPKGQTRSTYRWIGFAPTPSAALTYSLDYERLISDLVDNTDEPYWLPQQFHRILATGARRKEAEFQGDERLPVATDDWNRSLVKLVGFVNNQPDYVLVPGGANLRRSDLGAQYPVGTIWD